MLRKVLLALISLLFITGCATTEDDESGFSRTDVMFAEMMIPHHEQAIEMSDLALINTTNPSILELANEIKAAQAPEIELMSSWPGVDAMAHMGHSMSGMLSDAEMAALAAATGTEFDRLFLTGMIKHHEGAIEMAQDVVDSKNQTVVDLADAIIQAQRAEISRMQSLLD